ncbi:MAG: hypothetical protein AAF961_17140, partial [Planctomycetota bacterium]
MPDTWKINQLGPTAGSVAPSDKAVIRFDVQAPANAEATRPYWKRESLNQARYDIVDQRFRGLPLPLPALSAHVDLAIGAAHVRVRQPVEVELPVEGGARTRYPLQLLPALSVTLAPRRRVVPFDVEAFPIDVSVTNLSGTPVAGILRLEATGAAQVEPASVPFRIQTPGEAFDAVFSATRVGDAFSTDRETATIRAIASVDDRSYSESVRQITAPDLNRFPYYEPATVRVAWADLKMPDDLRIGYVRGTGDEVGEVLESLGGAVAYLDEEDLASGDLSRFDAIVVGVRAYAVRDDLIEHNERLLKYVFDGGVAVVQYQTPEFDNNYGPYPYVMGRRPEEVSEQDAAVRMLAPEHPLMQYPNRIGGADFDGWVEQRGSKFLAEWGDRYVPLLACKDYQQPT